jgi:hypothetical protein
LIFQYYFALEDAEALIRLNPQNPQGKLKIILLKILEEMTKHVDGKFKFCLNFMLRHFKIVLCRKILDVILDYLSNFCLFLMVKKTSTLKKF